MRRQRPAHTDGGELRQAKRNYPGMGILDIQRDAACPVCYHEEDVLYKLRDWGVLCAACVEKLQAERNNWLGVAK